MVDTALASLMQTMENIQKHQYFIHPHHQQITYIYEGCIVMQELVDNSPEKANFLERRLRYVAYEAHHIIEELISSSRYRLNMILPKFCKFNTDFSRQLEEIREQINSITEELRAMVTTNTTRLSSTIAQTSKVKDMDSLDDDLVAIKPRLCGGSSKLLVIPVVGMGGIGKTTLATNVYNDPLAIQYFDIRAWVTVSQNYSTQKIVSDLVDSMHDFFKKKFGQSDEETMYKGLKGRRYLIVMDDVWSTNAWDDVRNLCPDDHNGSRIMLTTRLSDVAAYFDSYSPLHEMRFMSVQQSWELLRQRVLGDEECSSELERIGEKIAESCRGLPLAIVVIAGLLSTVEKKPDAWWGVAEKVSSIVVTEDGQFDEILSLSYTHLPHRLRLCFLYMGGFPEDHDIHVSELVKLWVAEGFLRCATFEGSSKSLEKEAEECLEDLVNRSLVLVTKRKYNGRIKSCSLHDLIRNLYIRKAQENNLFLNLLDSNAVDKEFVFWVARNKRFKKSTILRNSYLTEELHFIETIKKQNRVSVGSSSLIIRHLPLTDLSTIHTIMCFPPTDWEKHTIKLDFLKSVKLLRVLVVEIPGVHSLPNKLFKLFELRYLAIGCFMNIPAEISRLRNLQTLILDARNRRKLIGRPIVGCLPQEIWMMPQLRHLICHSKLPNPKQTYSALKNLQTLSLVMNDMCFEGILEKIPNVEKLGFDCSSYDSGTHLNNLVHLHQLERLELRNAAWRRDSISFPAMLRRLTLCNMSLPWSDMSIVGSLPNLQVLKLRDFACIGSTWETCEGEFTQPQLLLIDTSKLEHWITERSHFPRLKSLLLHDCWYLSEIPEGIGEITTLELIHVRGHARAVPISLAESVRRIQEEQQSFGNDALQLHCPLPESCVTNEWISSGI